MTTITSIESNPVNILIVDDNPRNLLTLEATLGADEYNLIQTSSGKEALKCLLENPDLALIIMDVQMPGMDGFETAQIIKQRQQTRGIPFIFLSANNITEGDFVTGYDLGAFDYITKPFSPGILRSKVKAFVDQYRLHQEKELLLRELEKKNRDLSVFTSLASHDLKSPLRKVSTLVSFIQKDCGDQLDSLGKEYLNRINQIIIRMASLLQSLLSYSQLSIRKLKFTKIDLNLLMDSLVDEIKLELEESQGNIEFESLPSIYGEPNLINQIFHNLISNSLKFRREGIPPVINISHRFVKEGWIEIKIKDNGIGFENKFAERIFQPFERLFSAEQFEGHGIGLASCEKIIQFHKGSIRAEGELSKGAIFTLTLPTKATE